MVRGPSSRLGNRALKAQRRQIERFDECLDHTDAVVLASPVIEAFRQGGHVGTIRASHETTHAGASEPSSPRLALQVEKGWVELGSILEPAPVADGHYPTAPGDQLLRSEFLSDAVHVHGREPKRIPEFSLRQRKPEALTLSSRDSSLRVRAIGITVSFEPI